MGVPKSVVGIELLLMPWATPPSLHRKQTDDKPLHSNPNIFIAGEYEAPKPKPTVKFLVVGKYSTCAARVSMCFVYISFTNSCAGWSGQSACTGMELGVTVLPIFRGTCSRCRGRGTFCPRTRAQSPILRTRASWLSRPAVDGQ